MPNGALRVPLAHRSFAAPPIIKKSTISRNKMLLFWPELGPPEGGAFSTELSCTLLSYIASYWAMLYSFELRCTLLSYAVPYWAMLHPTKLCILSWLHPLSLDAPFWATLHPSELRRTLSELSCAIRATLNPLSYATAFWATLHPTELHLTINELRGILKYNVPYPSQLRWSLQRINEI
jgi:hypothetical protein